MPVPTQIANAAVSFRRNRGLLEKSFKDLAPEEWLKSPSETANHILWIAGHIVWARSMTLKFLGAPAWSKPWLSYFGRGAKKEDGGNYPSTEEMIGAFEEVNQVLTDGLENASPEAMAAAAPPNTPPGDGTIGGVVNFLAFHETYHVGQVAYLRCWLGHEGPQG
jgi:uncharacterized damage-inducible protein DinB